MKYLKLIFGLLLIAILTACGGGGGSGGINTNIPTTGSLYVTAPSATIILPGVAQVYAIGGGRPPYRAVSGVTSVAVAAVNGTALTIGAINAGTSTINVTDQAGSSTTFTVTVPTTTAQTLYTTAQSTLSLVKGASQSYSIGGGTAPYSVTSSAPAVASVALSGSTFTINPLSAGAATIQVSDSAVPTPATINISLTVTTTAIATLTATPTKATGNAGTTANVVISGGVAPYQVTSTNPTVATGSISGSVLSAALITAGSATLVISDSANSTPVSVVLTVNAPVTTTLALSPSAFSVSELSTNVIPLYVSGGVAPYTAFTNNLLLSSTSVSGGTVDVGLGTQGNRCDLGATVAPVITLTVVDSVGSSATSAMTINLDATTCPNNVSGSTLSVTSGPSASVAAGASVSYVVSGGSAPYALSTVSAINSAVATATLSGTNKSVLTITGVSATAGSPAGQTSLTVVDSAGNTYPITVTVTAH